VLRKVWSLRERRQFAKPDKAARRTFHRISIGEYITVHLGVRRHLHEYFYGAYQRAIMPYPAAR
jgi:hypothetical protein